MTRRPLPLVDDDAGRWPGPAGVMLAVVVSAIFWTAAFLLIIANS